MFPVIDPEARRSEAHSRACRLNALLTCVIAPALGALAWGTLLMARKNGDSYLWPLLFAAAACGVLVWQHRRMCRLLHMKEKTIASIEDERDRLLDSIR